VSRGASTALVVKHNQPLPGDLLPHVIHQHVGMREARTAIHRNHGKRRAASTEGFISNIDGRHMHHAAGMGSRLGG